MDPWQCALYVAGAGAVGGVLNALLTENGLSCRAKKAGFSVQASFRMSLSVLSQRSHHGPHMAQALAWNSQGVQVLGVLVRRSA
jgi:hypothetical protein